MNPRNNTPHRLIPRELLTVLTFAALFFGSWSARAQTAPTPPRATAPAAGANDEDVVQLSEFTVTTDKDRGYTASETLTGPRVKTKIVDLPYPVDVLTSEFLEDFAIFDLDETFTQIGSFSDLSAGGGFNLRGFGSSSQLRDGFFRIGRYGTSNIDRIEVIKGPSAAVYGRTSPGGMVNMISKQPRPQDHTKLSLNFGNYSTARAVLESTGTLANSRLGKTTYLVTGSTFSRRYDQPYTANHHQEYLASIKQTFKDHSSLLLQAEYFLQIWHSPSPAAPLIIDQKGTSDASDDEAIGYATPLAYESAYGPHSEFNRDARSYTLTYEKALNNVWSLRVGSNLSRVHSWQGNRNTGFGTINLHPSAALPAGVTAISPRGTPQKQLYSEDSGGVETDLLAHAWVFKNRVESRSLFTVDLNDYYRWDPRWTLGAGDPLVKNWTTKVGGISPSMVLLGADLRPVAPINYFPVTWDWGYETNNQVHHSRITALGGLFSQQLGLFKNKLLVFGGARYDGVRYRQRNFNQKLGADDPQVRRTVTQLKPNAGVNYRFAEGFHAFLNYSEGYFVNQGDSPGTVSNPTYKPEVAHGWDYGIKGELLDGKLNFTFDGFYTVRQNVNVTDTFEDPENPGNYITQNRRDGDQLVRGYESGINWKITPSLNLVESWGHVYSIYTNFGSKFPEAVGRRVRGISPENGSVTLRYTPREGRLSGFSANIGYTYRSRTPTEQPNAGDVFVQDKATGAQRFSYSTRQWALSVPAISMWNVGIRYTSKFHGRYTQTISLNVNNVMDRRYLLPSRVAGFGRAAYITYQIGVDGRPF